MSSFLSELKNFKKNILKTVATSIRGTDGKIVIEQKDGTGNFNYTDAGYGFGFVDDATPDLQVGVVFPWLLIGSQDVALDETELEKYEITHILNLASLVENRFPEKYEYLHIEVRDLPDSNIIQYFPECISFINKAKNTDGRVLVHCNAGVSRASSVTIAYVMHFSKIGYNEAFKLVKTQRNCIQPNIGFVKQLHEYEKEILKK